MIVLQDPFLFRVSAKYGNGSVFSEHTLAIDLPDCFGGEEPHCTAMVEKIIRANLPWPDDIIELKIRPLQPTADGYTIK